MKPIPIILSGVALIATVIGLSNCDPPEKPKPEIASIDPASGPINTQVTITGKNLSATEEINFGAVSIKAASRSDTQIITAVPDGVVPGNVEVTVKTDGGTSNSKSFQVLHSVPEISAIEPEKGSIGMPITIKGKYLLTVSEITFGTKKVTTFSGNDAELQLTVPSEIPLGALNVTVKSLGGTSEAETFTVVGKPSVTSFTPEVGPAGRVVSISGSDFEEVSKVFFGAGDATVFVYKNATLIEATVPATATTGKVKVVTPGGEGLSPGDFTVKDAPEVTDYLPKKGLVGTVVTITGKAFEAGAKVKFGNGTATEVTVVNGTTITAKVPNTATTGVITVETVAGSGQSNGNFEVIGAPTVTSFSPGTGPAGTDVTINGTNFVGVTGVKFNNTSVPAGTFAVVSDIKITTKVPAGATTGKISVTTPAGTGPSNNNFTVQIPLSISGFTPPNGLTGSSVLITGTGFVGTTSVTIGGIDVGAGNFTINSDGQITAKVPANGKSGQIKVTNAQTNVTSSGTFYVTPFISSITPTQASAGSPITITGTNLENAKVKFNAAEMTPLTNSSTTITVNSPGATTGAMNVTVVNSGGTSNAKTFTATAPVVVDEVIASANIANQLILFKGSNLLGATKVWFGNTQATVLTSTSKVVTATIPASLAVGNYSVRVETSKGMSGAKSFQLLSAQNAASGGATLVTGSTVSSYSAPVTPPIANFWLSANSDAESFFITNVDDFGDGTFAIQFSNGSIVVDGTGTYDNESVDGVYNNIIDFTVNGGRYVGTWTQYTTEDDGSGGTVCMANITAIETKSGRLLKLKVQFGTDCP